MANTLKEYYSAQGQSLPTVGERQSVAAQAGITNYTGTADQNNALLGYLKGTPNAGSATISADSLEQAPKIEVKTPTPIDTTKTNGEVASIAEVAKTVPQTEQQRYDTLTTDITKLLENGDQAAANEAIYEQYQIDTKRKGIDKLTSQIEKEQRDTQRQIDALEKEAGGLRGGNITQINKLKAESASRLADYGIALSAMNRDYETAYGIATRQIQANTDARKASIEAKQFVLQQLGTKLATDRANAFTLSLRALDQENKLVTDAVKYITDGMESGTIDPDVGARTIQGLTNGSASLSQAYNAAGNTTAGIIAGVDISRYATDPQHEQKVLSIYNTIGNIANEASADVVLKKLAPSTKITGKMVMDSASKYGIDPALLVAMMQQDSSLGTKGLGAKNNNPGNIGQFDELGTNAVDGYKTLGEGVDAVAKWLSNNKAKARYNGEFSGTLETVVNAVNGVPDKTRKQNLQNLQKYIADGEYKTAYTQIQNTVANALPAEEKNRFVGRRNAIPAINTLEQKLQEYAAAGGKTGLLKGTFENIYSKLGEVKDPKYKALATELKIALQEYRQKMSGAAFSEQEARDYASVNPQGTNKLDLNLSIINGMRDNFQRSIDSTVDAIAGEGAQYIREYAMSGTKPITTNTNTPVPTPTGNSFTFH